MVEPLLGDKGLVYANTVSPELRVLADPDKLRQIILNLLSNSIKFTDAGGRVTIDSEREKDVPDDVVLVRVTDTGCGIPPSKQDDVFDPFVQLNRQHAGSSTGIGLGLAISRDLARGMRGDLRVRSEGQIGSTFLLTLMRG